MGARRTKKCPFLVLGQCAPLQAKRGTRPPCPSQGHGFGAGPTLRIISPRNGHQVGISLPHCISGTSEVHFFGRQLLAARCPASWSSLSKNPWKLHKPQRGESQG